jgi:hypothetical protein
MDVLLNQMIQVRVDSPTTTATLLKSSPATITSKLVATTTPSKPSSTKRRPSAEETNVAKKIVKVETETLGNIFSNYILHCT